jgi:hypothetical protein
VEKERIEKRSAKEQCFPAKSGWKPEREKGAEFRTRPNTASKDQKQNPGVSRWLDLE